MALIMGDLISGKFILKFESKFTTRAIIIQLILNLVVLMFHYMLRQSTAFRNIKKAPRVTNLYQQLSTVFTKLELFYTCIYLHNFF